MLPQDPFILYSYLNTKLRDAYPSLEALCEDNEVDPQDLLGKLEEAGFRYDPGQNQVRPMG